MKLRKKESKKSSTLQFLAIVIALWIGLSIFNSLYNSIKIITESSHWLGLTEYQKKHEIYGDIYSFILFINENTSDYSRILVYSKDDKAYFLGRYILYPKEIRVAKNINEISALIKTNNFDYFATDDNIISSSKFSAFASTSSFMLFKRI